MKVKIPVVTWGPLKKLEEDAILRIWDEELQRYVPPPEDRMIITEIEVDISVASNDSAE